MFFMKTKERYNYINKNINTYVQGQRQGVCLGRANATLYCCASTEKSFFFRLQLPPPKKKKGVGVYIIITDMTDP